jgi:hypothetical protein
MLPDDYSLPSFGEEVAYPVNDAAAKGGMTDPVEGFGEVEIDD